MSAKFFGTAALVATLANAANVNVHNKCNFDVQLTPSQGGTDQSAQTLPKGQSKSYPAAGEAWCLKMYGPGANQPTQLEWSTWGQNLLSYDLSNIDMGSDTTFLRYGMSLTSQEPACANGSKDTCKPALCPPTENPSTTPCKDAYNHPLDVRTLGASASYDIDMVLCSGSQAGSGGSSGSSGSGSSAPQAPAPKPATTLATSAAAPAPSQQQSGGHPVQVDGNGNAYEGNVVTTVVANTQMVTQYVTAREAEATAEAEPVQRRHVHHHAHHHNA